MNKHRGSAVVVCFVLAACGSGDDGDGLSAASDTAPVTATAPASVAGSNDADSDSVADVAPSENGVATAATDVQDETSSGSSTASSYDPVDLEPGTAVVSVDGNEYRFERGDGTFDVCELNPDFELGEAEMDLVGGPEEGSPHLDFHYGPDKQVMVVAFLPDTAYIVGKGEETDPYFQQFGVVPPRMDPIEVGDGMASGITRMVDGIAGDDVEATFAIRCR
ncbi:hypothetical protein BDK89_0317 [Ilumatobacter fluminis]|uniref:Uncharacterized protein n=1 Tax=Ilumatobacter fluminis TaxID=467091 RepID=A0A4R7HUX8_9ACTN|nr:hypothetical protein [Ilumatobacter fluminis]TDT14761.1 hypothetical protein BDK89_0317 [Ilumatobacter fluminis]